MGFVACFYHPGFVWLVGVLGVMVISGDLSKLMLKQNIKVGPSSLLSPEEVTLAIIHLIGHGYVTLAAHMNSAVVFFMVNI